MGNGERTLEFWLQDLERRRTFAKPEHTLRGFFFKGMLESFRTLGDEALVRRCVEACGQERFVDFFNYPVQLMFPLLFTALPVLAERYGGGEAALRYIGRQSSLDFLGSVSGKAMLLLAQGSPRLLLTSMPTAYRVAMSFGHAWLDWSGPTRGRLTMHHSFVPPPVHEGTVLQMLEAGRTQRTHAVAYAVGDLDVACDFSWE
jgi:uncharacterized protein (TIGR02265 family)